MKRPLFDFVCLSKTCGQTIFRKQEAIVGKWTVLIWFFCIVIPTRGKATLCRGFNEGRLRFVGSLINLGVCFLVHFGGHVDEIRLFSEFRQYYLLIYNALR